MIGEDSKGKRVLISTTIYFYRLASMAHTQPYRWRDLQNVRVQDNTMGTWTDTLIEHARTLLGETPLKHLTPYLMT
jgi:hypothetical protein